MWCKTMTSGHDVGLHNETAAHWSQLIIVKLMLILSLKALCWSLGEHSTLVISYKSDTLILTLWVFYIGDTEDICVELNSDNTVKLLEQIRRDRDGGDIVNEGQRMRSDSFKEPWPDEKMEINCNSLEVTSWGKLLYSTKKLQFIIKDVFLKKKCLK